MQANRTVFRSLPSVGNIIALLTEVRFRARRNALHARVSNVEELISHLPGDVRFDRSLPIENGKSEYEIVEYFKARAAKTAERIRELPGGRRLQPLPPGAVDVVVSRGEFLTSYTPYQAEISQGTLTSIFEFQTMVCQLTGMDVANASMYDGSSAVPEAAMMAVRITRRDRVLMSRTVHPEYREVLTTYLKHAGMPVARVRV